MKDTPLVSVAIPCYNHEQFVEQTIQSVIDQDYTNIELIIIDDGSSDRSVDIIKKLNSACEERFVRFEFISRPNKGLSATLNEALSWSTGCYFSAIASDDLMHKNKTSVLVEYLRNDPNTAAIFCAANRIDENGFVTRTRRVPNRVYNFDDILLRKHHCPPSTQLFRMSCLKSVNGYRDDILIEDWYMLLALSEKGFNIRIVDEVLTERRRHDSNISNDALKMYEGRKAILSNYKDNSNYKKSLASVCLTASLEFTSLSKRQSIRYLFEGFQTYKKVVFHSKFYSCLGRILVPRLLFVWLNKESKSR